MQLYCCFCKKWKPKSDTVSGSKHQDSESEIPEKKVILFWVILAITLTALRCFQVPRNTEGSDIVTIVPTSWKIKVNIRKERGVERDFFFLYFDIFLPWQLHTKGSFWSLECWAHTCGMKSKPSVNYIKYALPRSAHASMCFQEPWKDPLSFSLLFKKNA